MWGNGAPVLVMFLGACGRIGYDALDDRASSDASITELDVSSIDVVGDPPGSEAPINPGADVGVDPGDGFAMEDGEAGPAEAGTCTGGPFPLLHWNISPAASVAATN